jgi:hypothetical protein
VSSSKRASTIQTNHLSLQIHVQTSDNVSKINLYENEGDWGPIPNIISNTSHFVGLFDKKVVGNKQIFSNHFLIPILNQITKKEIIRMIFFLKKV